MKILPIPSILAVVALCNSIAFAESDAVATPSPLPTAVLDFEASDRSLEKKGSEVGVLLNAMLSSKPSVILVERQQVEKVLAEQELGLSGTIAPESVAKVGALLGAKVLVTGRIFESDGKGYLVAKVIGTETGRVFGETMTAPSLNTLDAQVAGLAEKIATTLEKQSSALVAKIEEPDARIARLKKSLSGKTLPAVLVTISEQHLARPVTDPAAQTELMKTLQEVGFEVLNAAAAVGRNDVATVTGEAFSELGMRRGNLVSCRARVEVTVKDASGKLLTSDRQMDVGVDISEHIAGKKALEAATLKLADRLVPLLVK
jgi:hypothetical protein